MTERIAFLYYLLHLQKRSLLDLPPFPTRRSSDLRLDQYILSLPDGLKTQMEEAGQRFSGGERHRVRSEEHTSELQSRENLVCRLLLEKKKSEEFFSILVFSYSKVVRSTNN